MDIREREASEQRKHLTNENSYVGTARSMIEFGFLINFYIRHLLYELYHYFNCRVQHSTPYSGEDSPSQPCICWY